MSKQYNCKVTSISFPIDGIIDLTLLAPEATATAEPGQFAHIKCGGDTYLRRPISICDCNADKGTLRLIIAIKGEGTKNLAQLKKGDKLDILAPLGIGFSLPSAKTDKEIYVVGGGIGTFPLLYLCKRLRQSGCDNITAILGFRSKSSILLEEEFAEFSNVVIATDDDTAGYHGTVADVYNAISLNKPAHYIYACGPTPMLKAVQACAKRDSAVCQLSLEERMACGIGVCNVCACRVNGSYKRVCSDGPVFNADDVM